MNYGELDIPSLLRSVAREGPFGEGDTRYVLDVQRLDYLLRQQSPEFTVTGLGEYVRGLEDGERRRLLPAARMDGSASRRMSPSRRTVHQAMPST